MPNNTGLYCAYAKMWIAVKWEWNLGVDTTIPGTGSVNTSALPEDEYLESILNNNC
jgi:hypothetical protein